MIPILFLSVLSKRSPIFVQAKFVYYYQPLLLFFYVHASPLSEWRGSKVKENRTEWKDIEMWRNTAI